MAAVDQWVILELSPKAEGEDPALIQRSISYALRGAEVFIPAAVTQVGEDRIVHYLVEGYAFVRHTHEQSAYNRLENSKYVQMVLSTVDRSVKGRPVRQLAFVKDADIEKMKRQIHVETDQGIGVGDLVLITAGAYRQITAKVIEDINEEDKVQVHIKLRSKDTIVSLPRSFLQLVTKAPRPEYLSKFENVKEWFNERSEACRYQLWAPALDPLRQELQRFQDISQFSDRMAPLAGLIRAVYARLDLTLVVEQTAKVQQLVQWTTRWQTVSPPVQAALYTSKSTYPLQVRSEEWAWLDNLQRRIDTIRADVLRIERKMTGSEEGYDYVLVDGLNLAMRVFYAPGMADLRDTKSRPSGVIYGFIQSLGAIAKRFPGARICVCWDGSNEVRKTLFAGYKANRNPNPLGPGGWDQIKYIQDTLPSLGVAQYRNQDEEADDVIASLVWGPLKGHRKLILSSDRDFLQLVTETTHVLTPAQGKRKEAIYTTKAVSDEWGVEPFKMVTLRALMGDNSDTIPGVPTVPKDILVGLVELYGTIDGIFASNLAGLTKLRYEKLRTAEKQVRLNYELMRLRLVSYEEVSPNPNQITASDRLTSVSVKVEPVLKAFFGKDAQPGSSASG